MVDGFARPILARPLRILSSLHRRHQVSQKLITSVRKKALLEQHAKQEVLMQKLLAQLEEERARVEQLEVRTNEIEELRQTANVRGLQSATTLQFDEATTRKQLIDIQLASAGWQILTQGEAIKQDRLSFVTVEEEIHEQPTPSGVGYADYVLWDEGLPIAVIEAKKTSVDAEKRTTSSKTLC